MHSQEGSGAMSNQERQNLGSIFPALVQNLVAHEMFSHIHILLTKQAEVIFQVFIWHTRGLVLPFFLRCITEFSHKSSLQIWHVQT